MNSLPKISETERHHLDREWNKKVRQDLKESFGMSFKVVWRTIPDYLKELQEILPKRVPTVKNKSGPAK